ncbi:hypothetical protein LVN26_002511 [Listeria monocytogenes]|nr:hypothetical protein [Listeria monocytogenes]EIQ6174573.1 hypothetical protein [Listeria monocytogenes]EIQ6205572.1 hypothetical protein [Listeria monocytogenes]EIQ6218914.1 hypothetical protein [Listeria monocytogenes]EIQ6471323.1 hypothetical protein [Listeria monocytogenes]
MLIDSNKLFSELAEEWLEQYKNTVKESPYVAQRLELNKHILPLFGSLKISKITIPYCQK